MATSADQVRADIVADPAGTLLALDFDGTLAHIVDDPAEAFAHHRSVRALSRLGASLGQIAIVTGRPVSQVLELGGFRELAGLEHLVIHGQYGAERWDAATDHVTQPEPPAAIADLLAALPAWQIEHDAMAVRVENKGLAVALHTRGLEAAEADRLAAPMRDLADQFGLDVEPGRHVLELRGVTGTKGDAIRSLIDDPAVRRVVFAGDDLGDLPAFEAVRSASVDGLLLCSASAEQDALVALADIVLDGPDAVADWLEELAHDI